MSAEPPPAHSSPDLPLPGQPRGAVSARIRLLTTLAVGLLSGGVASIAGSWQYAVLIGFIAAAGLFVAWMWISIWPMDASHTATHAVAENPGQGLTDLIVLSAAVASLLAIGLLLADDGNKTVQAMFSVGAVAAAWACVHTVFTTKYARLYYSGQDGGIDFKQDDPPRYSDFLYLAFTVGMTFQVSDTDLTSKRMRTTALRHALLSYLFGTVIIASTINLVAGLSK